MTKRTLARWGFAMLGLSVTVGGCSAKPSASELLLKNDASVTIKQVRLLFNGPTSGPVDLMRDVMVPGNFASYNSLPLGTATSAEATWLDFDGTSRSQRLLLPPAIERRQDEMIVISYGPGSDFTATLAPHSEFGARITPPQP